MGNERSNRALARIEAALARIESAPRSGMASAAGNAADAELAALQSRHDQLRQAVQGSLAQLDLLIESTPA
ncbi:MAG: hypothetical protein RLZZ427_773 [Pseudomonadota bacterium]|jgi:hypothetical protein